MLNRKSTGNLNVKSKLDNFYNTFLRLFGMQ